MSRILHNYIIDPTVNTKYEGISKSFRIDNEMYAYNNKHLLRRTQRVMAAKLTKLSYKTEQQLNLVADSSTVCSCPSRRPIRKLLDISPRT